jgi:hypothetical protein
MIAAPSAEIVIRRQAWDGMGSNRRMASRLSRQDPCDFALSDARQPMTTPVDDEHVIRRPDRAFSPATRAR